MAFAIPSVLTFGPLRVVLLEDDDVDAQQFSRLLDKAWPGAVDIQRVEQLAEMDVALTERPADVVFSDLSVADGHGIPLVEQVVAAAGAAPVVVLTGVEDPSLPVLALEAGAQDYLSKGEFDVELLSRTLRYSMARSRADEAFRQVAFDLQVANTDLEECLGIMAHDLRAPLRTGRLFADRLLAAWRRGDEGERLAEALDANLAGMESMIERLLWLSSLRSGALDPVEEPLSVAVGDITTDLQGDLDEAGGSFEVERDEIVRADRILLRELLRHLAHNSIRYRSPDRPLVVRFAAGTVGRTTTITVRDNGIGIDPRYRDRIFRLFERIDPERDGSGFGLACSRRIVELHRGRITMETPPDGYGIEGRILLPASR
jgi:signal transduction histidine kinase